MDAIWGADRFAAEIIWRRSKGGKSGQRWGRVNDRLLMYGEPQVSDAVRLPAIDTHYRHEDKHGRYTIGDLTAPGNYNKEWRGLVASEGNSWRAPRALPEWFVKPAGYDDWPVNDKLEELDRQKLIHWSPRTGRPAFKRYLSVNRGDIPGNIWMDIEPLAANAKSRRNVAWMTQKPVPLYERIVLASSEPGDMVLDPFCGCATTCIAAEKHGRHWVGIEKEEEVAKAMATHLKAEMTEVGTDNLFVKPRFTKVLPKRTDGDDPDPDRPATGKRRRVNLPPAERKSHHANLVERHGTTCQGCFTQMPRPRDLELDHITPKALMLDWNPDTPDQVINHPTNLTLLCSYCNRVKGDRLRLTDLRELLEGREQERLSA